MHRAPPPPHPRAPFHQELLFDFVREWYGLPAPARVHFRAVTPPVLEGLWTGLWFAKGALQAAVDTRLAASYGRLLAVPLPPTVRCVFREKGVGWGAWHV